MLITKAAEIYKKNHNIEATSRELHLSSWKTVKLLISAGIYPTPTAKKIKDMREKEYSEQEICSALGITLKTLAKYTPYYRCVYNDHLSANAVKIKKCR